MFNIDPTSFAINVVVLLFMVSPIIFVLLRSVDRENHRKSNKAATARRAAEWDLRISLADKRHTMEESAQKEARKSLRTFELFSNGLA